ncbi:MAG: hypothetical protein IBX62_04785 [Coriobacteriia bacterium]|nr:hypothetical protein [Coriobacteriia bacterium]
MPEDVPAAPADDGEGWVDMRHRNRILVLSLATLLVLSSAGCAKLGEKAAEKAVEKATGVKVEQDGDAVTYTGKDGESVSYSAGGGLPKDFPAGFPVYDGEIGDSSTIEVGEARQFTFWIRTADDHAKVVEWYKAELAKTDWTLDSSFDGESDGTRNTAFNLRRGTDENGAVYVTREADSGRTDVSVLLVVKK